MIGREYDEPKPALEDRLKWAHGPDRAQDIMAGRDAATAKDRAAWDRLGALAEERRK